MTKMKDPVAQAKAVCGAAWDSFACSAGADGGACATSLSIAVANAGGMGACGALLMKPEEIAAWCADFRAQSQGEFQINLWIPGPPPKRDAELERRQREYLAQWGPEVPESAAEGVLPDFDAQCQAMLEARPKAISSIMGLYAPEFVRGDEGARHFVVCDGDDGSRSKGSRSCGSRCDHRAGCGGGRTSRGIRCKRGGAPDGWTVCAAAAGGGFGIGSGDRDGWDRRCAGGSSGSGSWCERGHDRNRFSALS